MGEQSSLHADASAAPRGRQAERDHFTQYVRPALAARVRITQDAEGWPCCPGSRGRLEWRGAEADRAAPRLYLFTPRRRLIALLRVVPGVQLHQRGDTEAAGWIAATDREAIRAVGRLLRLRQRRQLTPAQQAALAARGRLALQRHRAASAPRSR
jgi:hypothetical protein